MYGLSQSGILANQIIARCLAIHGYHQTKFTPGLWRHVTCPIQFTLLMDDFGVHCVGKEHAQHLIYALETDYIVSKDWTGGIYCGITLKWDYENKHVDLSMSGYIKDALHKFQHPMPKRPQYAPHNCTVPAYGQCIHYAPLPDASPPSNSTRNNTFPSHCGHSPLQCLRRISNPSCTLEHSGLTIVNSHKNNHQCCITSL
jgi:hypothetical protein